MSMMKLTVKEVYYIGGEYRLCDVVVGQKARFNNQGEYHEIIDLDIHSMTLENGDVIGISEGFPEVGVFNLGEICDPNIFVIIHVPVSEHASRAMQNELIWNAAKMTRANMKVVKVLAVPAYGAIGYSLDFHNIEDLESNNPKLHELVEQALEDSDKFMKGILKEKV